MKKLILSVAIGAAVLGLAGCKSKPAEAPVGAASDAAMMDSGAPSAEPSVDPEASGTGTPSDGGDGQGGGINRPPAAKPSNPT